MLFFILLLCATLTRQEIEYHRDDNSWYVYDRLLYIMRTYAEETKLRVGEMNTIRAYYELSAQFEMGYIVSEILERYRKMVMQIKGPYEVTQNAPGLSFAIKRCEYVQKLFFEIYHLCNMAHEIERKWQEVLKRERKRNTGRESEELDEEERRKRVAIAIQRARHNRLREIKKRKKWRKKVGHFGLTMDRFKKGDRKPQNKWWPLDYGWEIDYYW